MNSHHVMQEQKNVDTQVLTPSLICKYEYKFSIPSYQRAYVWPPEDATKLLNDINEARLANEPYYFIGTVLTAQTEDAKYELIDGQQRITTLMLIALAFKKVGVESKLTDVITFENEPRLQFDIRDQVQQLLGYWAGLEYAPPSEDPSTDDYLKSMNAALNALEQWIVPKGDDASGMEDRRSLADYILNRVKWVNNTVPEGTDLNRLFSAMNTTGVQLEQSDILKSKLLKKVKTDKALYEAIWVSCEHMESYFEANLRKVFSNAAWDEITQDQLSTFKVFPRVELKDNAATSKGLTIAELAKAPKEALEKSSSEPNIAEKNESTCRSIIRFPLLLIHTYRVFLALKKDNKLDVKERVHQDRLLDIFQSLADSDESEIKLFIETLWQVRYQFDQWVVKWVEHSDSNDEQLSLINQKAPSSLAMLQSVLYFTGDRSAQYWITPFITALIRKSAIDTEEVTVLLEGIDDQLSLLDKTENRKVASFKQACEQEVNVVNYSSIAVGLQKAQGTKFRHYWFQKLEYLLWKKFEADKDIQSESAFKKFRITSKNSVEHVHAQKEEHGKHLDKHLLDAFGNLVLLSPSENSSYSNQSVKKKMDKFENKQRYDSLKLKAIYDSSDKGEHWGETEIKQHQEAMLKVLSDHYKDLHEEER